MLRCRNLAWSPPLRAISSLLWSSQRGRQGFLIAENIINAITWIKRLCRGVPERRVTPAGTTEQRIRKKTIPLSTRLIHPTIPPPHSPPANQQQMQRKAPTPTHTDNPRNLAWLSVFMRAANLSKSEGGDICSFEVLPDSGKDTQRTQSGPVSPIRLPRCFPNATSPPLWATWHCITIPPRSVLS